MLVLLSCGRNLFDTVTGRARPEKKYRYELVDLHSIVTKQHLRNIMSRTDGRKIVAVATVGMVAVVGFAQIYLPFIADRDKIRGLSEEEDMPPSAKEEMRRAMMAAQGQQTQGGGGEGGAGPRTAGSMWKNIGGGGGGGR